MPELSYRLPLSYLRLSGTVSVVRDKLAASPREVREPDAQVELLVTGDEAHPLRVTLDAGAWRDAEAAFEFAEDGRLVSASRQAVGQGGKLLTGIVHVVTSVASAVAGLARPIIPFAVTDAAMDVAADAGEPELAAAESEATSRVDQAYADAHPNEAQLRTGLQATHRDLTQRLAEVINEAGAATTRPARREAMERMRLLRAARSTAAEELERVNAHFAAWRATTQVKRREEHEYKITLDELAMAKVSVSDGALVFPEPGQGDHPEKMLAAQEEIRDAWNDLGVLVVVQDTRQRVLRHDVVSIPAAASDSVVVRTPRSVILQTYGRQPDGNAALLSSRPASVLDELCDHQSFEVRSGIFGESKGVLEFSEEGVLSKLGFGTKSGAAAAAEAVGKVPETIAASLETSAKIADALDKERLRSTDRAIARSTKQVELKQKELELAGLGATEADHAELKRLTQEAEVLQKRKEIAGYAPSTPSDVEREIAALKQEVELLRARQQVERLRRATGDFADAGGD